MIPPTSTLPTAPASAPASPTPPAPEPSSTAPRLPDRSGLIIERPDLQRRRERFIYGTITAVAWILWAYLWLPLVTLVAWYFGVRAFIREVMIPDRMVLLTTGATYLLVILVLGGALLVWSRYNLHRFGGEDRRASTAPLRSEDIQDWFDLSASTLALMRKEGSVVVEHGDAGEVREVRTPDAGNPAGRPPEPAAEVSSVG